jgi:small conductance mechanosensitive channel
VLAIRRYTNNATYWQVCFETSMAIREVLGNGGFPAQRPVFGIRQIDETAPRA